MTGQGILDAFASHDFLQALSERHRLALASGAKPFTVAAGEFLAREGEPAEVLYLIQSGQVALGSHVPGRGFVPSQSVGPGEAVGWSWLVAPHRWQFDARAEVAVHGLAIDGEWLRGVCERDHELAYHLLKQMVVVLAGRLAALRRQLRDAKK
jgi:CRP-like cAMP-binding protein